LTAFISLTRLLPFASGLAALIAFGLVGFAEGPVYTEDSFAMGAGFVLLIAGAVAALRKSPLSIQAGVTAGGVLFVAWPLLHDLGGSFAAPSRLAFAAALVAAWLGAWRVADAVVAMIRPSGPWRKLASLAAPVILAAAALALWTA
jgi:hypothetical protein